MFEGRFLSFIPVSAWRQIYVGSSEFRQGYSKKRKLETNNNKKKPTTLNTKQLSNIRNTSTPISPIQIAMTWVSEDSHDLEAFLLLIEKLSMSIIAPMDT